MQQTDAPQAPVCGRGAQLAADIKTVVSSQCARCAGTGPQCLIELIYAEALPSTLAH
jgi:hypothetical protein